MRTAYVGKNKHREGKTVKVLHKRYNLPFYNALDAHLTAGEHVRPEHNDGSARISGEFSTLQTEPSELCKAHTSVEAPGYRGVPKFWTH